MRGEERRQRAMLVVFDAEQRVPKEHPLRRIKQLADAALKELSPLFEQMYSAVGRPSIPPERLLKASLLMALYTVRSERLFCEQLDYNFLFRWFLDLEVDGAGFDHSTFSLTRGPLTPPDKSGQSDSELRRAAAQQPDPSVDDRSPGAGGQEGRGKEAKLCFSAHALMENRSTILVVFRSNRPMAMPSGAPRSRWSMSAWPAAAGGDKGYDTRDFIAACRTLTVTPHVARNLTRAGGLALDARTMRHPGYEISQWIRKRVEEAFGWMKTIGGLRRTRYRGCERVQMHAYLVAAAYNLIRIAKLSPGPA